MVRSWLQEPELVQLDGAVREQDYMKYDTLSMWID